MLAIVDTEEEAWAEQEAFMVEVQKQRLCKHRQKQGRQDDTAGRGDTGGVEVGGSATLEEEGANVPVSDATLPQGVGRANKGSGIATNLRTASE